LIVAQLVSEEVPMIAFNIAGASGKIFIIEQHKKGVSPLAFLIVSTAG
jgi:hypothetical protein